MVCLSVLGDGETSGSSIRAKRFYECFIFLGYKVKRINPCIKTKIHPLVNFILNFILSLPKLFISCETCYSLSDLFPDAMFGILYKLIHPKVKFICGCHSLVQRNIKGRTWLHAFYSYYSQQTILLMLTKWCDRLIVSNNYDNSLMVKRGFKEVKTVYAAPNF